ncbi:MAG TPA: hypothetical protein VMT85_24785 [Thermoanaerobaculia bacterium]|nr:hypothetical protein [Thermoanaerobaculia bacterium]
MSEPSHGPRTTSLSRAHDICLRGVALAALLLGSAGAAVAEGEDGTVAVCLTNSLEKPISYEYRWGLGSWSRDRLEVGAEVEHRFDLDPLDGRVPWLQVRYRRSFGEKGMRTVVWATPPADPAEGLDCEPVFSELGPAELAAMREKSLRNGRERWHDAAGRADREVSSAIDLYFEAPRKERSVVRVWKLGDARPVVLGRISELRQGPRSTPVALWGEGRYLVEIFDDGENGLLDSFVLEAKELSEITRLSPLLDLP